MCQANIKKLNKLTYFFTIFCFTFSVKCQQIVLQQVNKAEVKSLKKEKKRAKRHCSTKKCRHRSGTKKYKMKRPFFC